MNVHVTSTNSVSIFILAAEGNDGALLPIDYRYVELLTLVILSGTYAEFHKECGSLCLILSLDNFTDF